MSNGALPTESVEQVFKHVGLLGRYERFKKGEPVEALLKEAAEALAQRAAPVKTRQGLSAAAHKVGRRMMDKRRSKVACGRGAQ